MLGVEITDAGIPSDSSSQSGESATVAFQGRALLMCPGKVESR